MIRIDLHVHASCLAHFYSLLEKGVQVRNVIGCTLRDFLNSRLGFPSDYIDQRIQTLFLDFRPVDDVETTVVRDGATLALSSAMPGLVGATMRKGGRYAVFRKDISQQTDECTDQGTMGSVTIKLFNMVAKEMGAYLLESGVETDGNDLGRVMDRCLRMQPCGIVMAAVDGRNTVPDQIRHSPLADHRRVMLTVKTA